MIEIVAPSATSLAVVLYDRSGEYPVSRHALAPSAAGTWMGEVPIGVPYGLIAEGVGPRFDSSKTLLDPDADAVVFPPRFTRHEATLVGTPNGGRAALAVHLPRRTAAPPLVHDAAAVVYEAHVRGLTVNDPHNPWAGTYRGLIDQLPRLRALGFTAVELLPVHQSDPQEGSYWGYMPLVFGAVEQRYAMGDDAAGELAELVEAAHEQGIEIWLDVVFNHTTEVDAAGPTYNLRGIADAEYYRLDEEGRYLETTGCGNDLDTSSPIAADLVIRALDHFADLGVDGFRFDLATVLSRHRPFIERLDEWGAQRTVRLIAEAWDAAGTYEVGRAWPGRGWMQWNDRFRDDVRGFLRAEPGLVHALQLRMSGSPDLFESPLESVNFITAHDGFTLYDLVAYDRKHNESNGHHNTDGSGNNRSWNCGWEGEIDAPAEVLELRQRQLRNGWALLAMAHGVPMATMGDEFGRTQRGNNNAYNQDNEISWVDWDRRRQFANLERFVGELLALRSRHPVLSQREWWGDSVRWFGATGGPDLSEHSRSLGWCVGDLCVMANAWWEPLEFRTPEPGAWRRVVDTSLPAPDDIVVAGVPLETTTYELGPRSVVILER